MISYIKNLKWKSVYTPFVFYSLMFLMLSPILYYCGLSNTHLSTTAEWLKSIGLILRFRTAPVDLLGQFWFLPILFWSHALTLVVAKCKYKGWVCLVAFIIYTIGRLMYNEGYKEPYDFSRIMYLSAFYMMGYSTYRYLTTLFLNKYIVIISASLFIGLTFIPNLVFADVILYAIVAFLGILITYALSKQIAIWGGGGKYILMYIGRNTMCIYVFHCLAMKLVELILSHMNLIEYSIGWKGSVPENNYWWLYTIVGIVLPVCFYKIKSLIIQAK